MNYKAIILILLFSFISVNSAHSKTIKIKFAHNFPDQSPFGMGVKIFQNLAQERLHGKVKVEVFPNSVLGNNKDILEQLGSSSIEFALIRNYQLTDYSKKFMVYGLPFIFEDFGTVVQFQNSQSGEMLLSEIEKKTGLKGLGN